MTRAKDKTEPGDGAGLPRVKILVAVWGKAYIGQLERFGFSSFLAPGNLPAMARRCAVELVVLTCADDVEHFEALPLMAGVREHAEVRYIAIDDLIAPGHYSTTLTLAFMRGVAAYGDAMTQMHFVFWNADFVLSDGAFDHLAGLIQAGRKVVITGTLRAVAEQAEGLLDAMRPEPTSALAVSSRTLVELAFRHQHPHHVAKTVNQDLCWTTMPSQMLWRVDAHTTLCRFFKAFMFCLRPTRVVTRINGPCDYTFVPELCPGEPQTMITDSDDAFILELQPRDSEAEFIRLGKADEDVRRRCMNEWLTAEHLDTGRRVVVVRSGDAPAQDVAAAQVEFEAYFDRFMAGVEPPRSHVGQYYWVYGVAAWRSHRDDYSAGQREPRELDATLAVADLKHPTYANRSALALAPAVKPKGLKGGLRVALFGRPHEPRRLHPDAPATPILEAAAREARAHAGSDGPIVAVAELAQWADLAFPMEDPCVHRLEPTAAAAWSLRPPPRAEAAFVYARPYWDVDMSGLLERLSGGLENGAHVCIVLHDAGWKARPGWIDEQLLAGLPLHGMLDELSVARHEGTRRERRYAEAFYYATDCALVHRTLGMLIKGALCYAPALLARVLGLGSRAPSERPLVAVVTGRYRAEGTAA